MTTATETPDYLIARTILTQVGGHMAMRLLGVPRGGAVMSERSVTISIRGSKKCNRITITLDGNDTYSLRFHKFTAERFMRATLRHIPSKDRTVSEIDGIYNDMLQDVIEDRTGLYLTFQARN